MSKIRILIVDDHAVMRMGLASLLRTCPEFEVVGDCGDCKSALRKTEKSQPDTVILDLMMPGTDGAAATAAIREKAPESKVLLLTTFGTSDGIAHALSAGAAGALMKNAANADLLKAIHDIATGGHPVSDSVRQLLSEDPPARELTDKQRKILLSIVRGLTNREIALEFDISPNVVKGHLNAIFTKIGAANRAEAVAIALRKHLLKI